MTLLKAGLGKWWQFKKIIFDFHILLELPRNWNESTVGHIDNFLFPRGQDCKMSMHMTDTVYL